MPAEPLYPAYLPTRPDGFSATIDLPPFDSDEPGMRANRSKCSILASGAGVKDITPRIGSEIRGVQLSQLTESGLDEVALLAAERGVLVFVSASGGIVMVDAGLIV
jgi:sulfonate dioxygenase